MSISFINLNVYILVFIRMLSCFFFNPILARQNVPVRVKTVFVLLLTLLVAPNVRSENLDQVDDFLLLLMMMNELIIGILYGFIVQIFVLMLFFAGDVMDYHFGLSMSKVFDPNSNIQASSSGTWLNMFFILYIFASNAHLDMIHVFAMSYELVPLGSFLNSSAVALFVIDCFQTVFTLTIRLIVPFVLMEFLLEAILGILMKLIPQIHIFILNMQLKLIMAFSLLILLSATVATFIDRYMVIMLDRLHMFFR